VIELTEGDLVARLRHSALFASMSVEQLNVVANTAKRRATHAGQILFRVNEPGSAFYVILRGTFRVLSPGPQGDEVLNQLGPGEWFGEMSLLTGEPRAATVVAVSDGEVVELGRDAFAALSAIPSFTAALSQTLSHRLRARVLVRPRPSCPQVIAVISALPSLEQAEVIVNLAAALAEVGGGSVSIVDYVTFLRMPREATDATVTVVEGAGADIEAMRAQHTFVLLRLPIGGESAARLIPLAEAVWAFDDTDDAALTFLRSLSALPPLTFLRDLAVAPRVDDWRTSDDVSVIRKAPVVRLERGDPQAVTLRRFARRVLGRRVGLALSAGGAKGLAHIGVLRCFERAGIEIDLIAGTSMGGIIGGFVAAGRGSAELLAVFTELRADFRHRLLDIVVPAASLFRGEKKRALLNQHARELRIEELPLPFWTVAGDLVTGREVVLGSGPLAQALDATSAIPAVFPPVVVGDQTLVDGWVVNPLPTDVLRREGADIVIAVDASGPLEAAADFGPLTATGATGVVSRIRRRFVNPEIIRVVMRSMDIGARERTIANLALADTWVQPDVGRFSPSDVRPMAEIVERGEAAAEAALAGIKRVLEVRRCEPYL
jgi:predicted acylesterase/phospholipase RssA/CRP-like cAMP-binding protein